MGICNRSMSRLLEFDASVSTTKPPICWGPLPTSHSHVAIAKQLLGSKSGPPGLIGWQRGLWPSGSAPAGPAPDPAVAPTWLRRVWLWADPPLFVALLYKSTPNFMNTLINHLCKNNPSAVGCFVVSPFSQFHGKKPKRVRMGRRKSRDGLPLTVVDLETSRKRKKERPQNTQTHIAPKNCMKETASRPTSILSNPWSNRGARRRICTEPLRVSR